jgi:hypothetical protein
LESTNLVKIFTSVFSNEHFGEFGVLPAAMPQRIKRILMVFEKARKISFSLILYKIGRLA